MRRMLKCIGTVAVGATLILGAPRAANAQHPQAQLGDGWVLTLDGQFRPRIISDTGRDLVAEDSRTFVTQRTRIGVTLGKDGGPAFTLRLQDVRIWGEESDTLNDYSADGFDAHEAFLVVPLPGDMSFKAGRQEIIFDNHRLVGNVGWTQRARSFDGGRLMLRKPTYDADLFLTLLRESSEDLDGHVVVPPPPDPPPFDAGFGGLHLGTTLAETHRLAFAYYLRLEVVPDDDDNHKHTTGIYADGDMGIFGYTLEFYYQFGKMDVAGDSEDISALLFAIQPRVTFDLAWKPSVAAWFEYLSGDGTPQGTFDTLFATNHKFYGEMDFFLAIPPHTGNQGLIDIGGRFSANPIPALTTMLSLHSLRTVENSETLGTEIDIKVIVALMENLSLHALYGMMLPGDELARIRYQLSPADPVDPESEEMAYVTLDYTF